MRIIVALIVVAAGLASHGVEARPRAVANADMKYAVTVPEECRTEDGPGTFEAICAADLDAAKSAAIPSAQALLLEVDAEPVPADAAPYTMTEFRQEVPEAVCGESDASKVRLEQVTDTTEGGARIFTASVGCPEIKFLGLGERIADVRYVMGPAFRYRMMARVLALDAQATKAVRADFLQSFKPSPAGGMSAAATGGKQP